MAPDRTSRPGPWRQWLRLAGVLFVFHAGSAALLFSNYTEASLSHEEARAVLERLQSRFERDDATCAASSTTCVDPLDGMSFSTVLSEIRREWEQAEKATTSWLVLAMLSWLLTSCATLPFGRSRQPSAT